jgi:hypothetical protein
MNVLTNVVLLSTFRATITRENKQATGSNTRDRWALSRRDFLANTALLGAGLAVWPSLGAA